MTWYTAGYQDWLSVTVDEPNFAVQFNRQAERVINDFHSAADVAAQHLWTEHCDRPLYLALSGGLDSEYVANTLLRNQIPFTPVILKIGTQNLHESWYAEYWCHVNGVKPVILEYSFEQYTKVMVDFRQQLRQIKDAIQSPFLLLYQWANNKNGYLVYGGADMNLSQGKFYCHSLDFISSLLPELRHHPTSFFMYTPELALSYVNQFDLTQSEQYNKIRIYSVAPRPKFGFIAELAHRPEIKPIVDKISYILDSDQNEFYCRFWYGSQQEIIQKLQP